LEKQVHSKNEKDVVTLSPIADMNPLLEMEHRISQINAPNQPVSVKVFAAMTLLGSRYVRD
jgi:hypothetical protein